MLDTTSAELLDKARVLKGYVCVCFIRYGLLAYGANTTHSLHWLSFHLLSWTLHIYLKHITNMEIVYTVRESKKKVPNTTKFNTTKPEPGSSQRLYANYLSFELDSRILEKTPRNQSRHLQGYVIYRRGVIADVLQARYYSTAQ